MTFRRVVAIDEHLKQDAPSRFGEATPPSAPAYPSASARPRCASPSCRPRNSGAKSRPARPKLAAPGLFIFGMIERRAAFSPQADEVTG